MAHRSLSILCIFPLLGCALPPIKARRPLLAQAEVRADGYGVLPRAPARAPVPSPNQSDLSLSERLGTSLHTHVHVGTH